jgi:C4-dicarboxylate-specific signal transduction histidine kinase
MVWMEPGISNDAVLGSDAEARRRVSLGQVLMLVLVAFFLGPMFFSNLWGYLQSRRYLTEAAFKNIRNVAALEASETLEFVRAAQNLIPSIVAGNEHLFHLVRYMNDPGWEQEREAFARELRDHLTAKAAEGTSVEEFQVISRTGMLLASSDSQRRAGKDLSSSVCFRDGRHGFGIVGFDYGGSGRDGGHGHNQHGDSTHHHAHDTGVPAGEEEHANPRMLVSGPIIDGDGVFLGVFCARFAFDIHRALLLAHRDRTQHAMLYLVNDEGRVVCGSFDDTSKAPYGDWYRTSERAQIPLDAPWEGRYRTSNGEEVMVAYAPVPKLGWGVAVEVPVIRALADLERLKWQGTACSVALGSVLVVGSYGVWRMVVRPLRDLAHTSDRMASGAPGETVSPRGPDELVELATAFNRMSLALRDSQEIQERRIAERTQALRESQEFSELLLDSIDQRVVVLDRDYRILKENSAAARMHGRDLLGAQSFQVFEGLSAPPEDYPARRTFENGQPASAERSQRTIRGQEPIYIETYPVLDPAGAVESVVEIGRVVTAEKRLQMQMVYQEKMAAFGQLAAGVAHEIGNPLAAIESQLRMAQGDTGRAEETLQVVRKQVGRMDRMLRRLVDFTRRRRDEGTFASANQAIDDVAQLMEHDPRARNVTISRSLDEGLPGLRTKEDDLVQVLLNLGLNALDAVPGGGSVRFETSLEDGRVAIRVRDSGSGVPEAAQPHVFEPFFTTKGAGRGTGLGLFVSKGIIDAIGGSLELEETGPEGTTFVVRLDTSRSAADRGTA